MACGEFLRLQRDAPNLPRLRHLLLPVGCILEDVDICGLDEQGRKIFAQVIYLHYGEGRTCDVEQLETYGLGNTRLVFFCRCEEPGERNGVRSVSIGGEVKDWVLSDPEYARTL